MNEISKGKKAGDCHQNSEGVQNSTHPYQFRPFQGSNLDHWLVFFAPSRSDAKGNVSEYWKDSLSCLDGEKGDDLAQGSGGLSAIDRKKFCVVAVDGGVLTARELGFNPNFVLGDGDSVEELLGRNFPGSEEPQTDANSLQKNGTSAEESPGNSSENGSFIENRPNLDLSLPRSKDYTDGEMAIELVHHFRPQRIEFFHFFQGRWDMTFLNFQLLWTHSWMANHLKIHAGVEVIYFLQGSTDLRFRKAGRFSILPLERLKLVFLKGSLYPLDGLDLHPGSGFSLSNQCTGQDLSIKMDNQGLYLLICETGSEVEVL